MTSIKAYFTAVFVLAISVLTTGCQTAGNVEDAFRPSGSSVQQRQLDSRRFETKDESLVLNSIVSVLQDLGFKLDETDSKAGLVSGSKGTGPGKGWFLGTDIRITVTTRPLGESGTLVRTTFQNIRSGHDARYYSAEPVRDQKIYQEFFDRLAQSLFLEAHAI